MARNSVWTLTLVGLCVWSISCFKDSGVDPVPPPEFIYPLAIGNQWLYQYYYFHSSTDLVSVLETEEVNGEYRWAVQSANMTGETTAYLVIVSRRDTTIEETISLTDTTRQRTTTVRDDTVSFFITVSPDSIRAGWTTLIKGLPNSTTSHMERIPRYPVPFADTLRIGGAVYVNLIGLFSYDLHVVSYQDEWIESLALDSTNVRL